MFESGISVFTQEKTMVVYCMVKRKAGENKQLHGAPQCKIN